MSSQGVKMNTNTNEQTIVERMKTLTTAHATADSIIKTQTAKKDEIDTEIISLLEQYPHLFKDRTIASISGDIVYQVSATEQLSVNKAYQPSETITTQLLQAVRNNPSDYMTVALYKAYGVKPTDETIGEDQPFMMKTVKPRFNRKK